jgi:hypothetical protein
MAVGNTATTFTASDRIKQLNDIDRVGVTLSVRWQKG